MRIVGGVAGGKRLRVIDNTKVRPTTERAREALFDMLGQNLDGLSFLDVCSGSGAISFEAMSRGANYVVAIEKNRISCTNIKEVSKELQLGKKIEVLHGDARIVLKDLVLKGKKFDIIFCDPPWSDKDLALDILEYLIVQKGFWKVFVFEFDKKFKISNLPSKVSDSIKEIRKYGRTNLLFF